MTEPLPDEELLRRLRAEVEATPPLMVTFRAASLLELAGLVQLALRHPNLPANVRVFGRTLVDGIRAHVADRPAMVELLRRGDDPTEDR